jgi:hypothetical protein
MTTYKRSDVNKIIGELKFHTDNVCKLMDRLFDVAFDLQKDVEENAYTVKNPPEKKAPRKRKAKKQAPPTPDNSEETLDPPVADQELS